MTAYNYEALDPERFQHFVQALLSTEYPGLQCLPVGQPDGGRDALTHGVETVFQVKFRRQRTSLQDVFSWLESTLKAEAPKLERLAERGMKRYIIVTNQESTAHLDVGTRDRLSAIMTEYVPVPSMCLWRSDLEARTDANWDVRWTYPDIMNGTDALRALLEAGLSEHVERRRDALRAYIVSSLDTDKDVRFKQVELQSHLFDLFVDVPISMTTAADDAQGQPTSARVAAATFDGIEARILGASGKSPSHGYVVGASRISRPSVGAAAFCLHPDVATEFPTIVLEGAPGQGKSTFTQYLCQIHRLRLLNRKVDLEQVREELREAPVRLPFRIELRDLDAWLKRQNPFLPDMSDVPPSWAGSLEGFIAAQVHYLSGGATFDVTDLQASIRHAAVLIVLDGLDEVADVESRRVLLREINSGLARLREQVLSLQVVLTTRPAAFANSPSMRGPGVFTFQLLDLPRKLISEYADRWILARSLNNHDASDIRKTLNSKLNQAHMRDLARNPMQLAILLSLTHSKGSSLPDKRTTLYDDYVSLFFNREGEKSRAVRDHRDLLINVHRFLAWRLHVDAEFGTSRGSISVNDLQGLLTTYLESEGHPTSLVSELFHGMIERVVALVSRVEGTYEFEVQPLREYFAARFLYETAPYSPPGDEVAWTKPERFDLVARRPYWLNVTRFLAGCFSKGELADLAFRGQDLCEDATFTSTLYPQELIMLLLRDWVFTQEPRLLPGLIDAALSPAAIRMAALSPDRGRHFDFAIPDRCGGSHAVARAWLELRKRVTNWDDALGWIAVLKSNLSVGDRASGWFSLEGSHDTQAWFRLGRWLGVASALNVQQLRRLMELDSIEASWLAWMGDKMRHVEQDDQLLQALLDNMLSGHGLGALLVEPDSRFVLGSQSFDPTVLSWLYFDPIDGQRRAVDVLRNFGYDIFRPPAGAASGLVLQVEAISAVACAELEKDAKVWRTSGGPWISIADAVDKEFGPSLLGYQLALLGARAGTQQDRAAEARDLFDSAVPLVRRLRYAMRSSPRSAWWARQLQSASSRLEELIWLGAALSGGSSRVLYDNIGSISRLVKSLSQSECEVLLWSVTRGDSAQGRSLGGDQDLIGVTSGSPRLRALLSYRAGSTARRLAAEVEKYRGRDPIVCACALESAFQAMNATPSDTSLRRLEGVYRASAGVVSSSQYSSRRIDLSFELASRVMTRPSAFPPSLVATAEGVTRAHAVRSLPPVGAVAVDILW